MVAPNHHLPLRFTVAIVHVAATVLPAKAGTTAATSLLVKDGQ
jgi:hypothetical protein